MRICTAGPKSIPDGIVRKLEHALTQAMKEPSFIKGIKEDLRLPIFYRGGKELSDYVAAIHETYGRMLKELGLMK
jgi:tripartite-type tricarboxylate transporter receptor subunit TctC